MYFTVLLIISGAICTSAQRSHKLCQVYGCFESTDAQLCMILDGDDIYYADFKKGELVWDGRIPFSTHSSSAYEYAKYYRSLCKCNWQAWSRDKSVTSVNREPPEIIIYPRNEVIKEEENILICYINHFYPPSISITWSKNDEEVAVEDPFKKVLPNPDGTFHVLSYLNFVPDDGDIYSCTVEHEALQEPRTKFWEVVNVDTAETNMGPTIYFGCASVFGFIGVGTGVFFFVKGKQCSPS